MSARRYALAAALLMSCGVPALDTTGAIRCGAPEDGGLGLCPRGFECRLERCCPADSSTSTCPGVSNPTTGAPCSTNECRDATTSGPCCAPRATFPGGYTTTVACTSNAPCGEFGACITLPFLSGRTACVRRCAYREGAVTQCRAAPSEVSAAAAGSYVCVPDPEGRASNDGICIPDCTVVPSLCGTTQCNPMTHTCGSCVSNPALCAAGSACNRVTGGCGPCSALVPCPNGQRCTLTSGRCR